MPRGCGIMVKSQENPNMPATLPDVSTMTDEEKMDLISRIEDQILGEERIVWEHPLLSDLESLSVDDKIDWINQIWDTVKPSGMHMSQELRDELTRSHEEYLRDPGSAVSWEEAKANMLGRHAHIPS